MLWDTYITLVKFAALPKQVRLELERFEMGSTTYDGWDTFYSRLGITGSTDFENQLHRYYRHVSDKEWSYDVRPNARNPHRVTCGSKAYAYFNDKRDAELFRDFMNNPEVKKAVKKAGQSEPGIMTFHGYPLEKDGKVVGSTMCPEILQEFNSPASHRCELTPSSRGFDIVNRSGNKIATVSKLEYANSILFFLNRPVLRYTSKQDGCSWVVIDKTTQDTVASFVAACDASGFSHKLNRIRG